MPSAVRVENVSGIGKRNCKMGSNASGVYMIDSKYRIVDYNRVAKRLYPQLERGKSAISVL